MLQFQQVVKSYGDRTILNIDALQIKDGLYWVKGENGAGKTTLFRCIAGMIPFQGSITLDDSLQAKKQVRDYRLRVNYGEAEPTFPGYLTGHDLMTLVAEAKEAPQGQLDQYCTALGIGEYRYSRIDSYSSGMLKKTSLAMALVGNPRWILLDEPLITLDPEAQETLMTLVAERRKENVNFLISSHQPWTHQEAHISQIFHLTNYTLTVE